MNGGANETEDGGGNTALADATIDKIAVQPRSVDGVHDVTRHFPINGSIQQQQIDPGK